MIPHEPHIHFTPMGVIARPSPKPHEHSSFVLRGCDHMMDEDPEGLSHMLDFSRRIAGASHIHIDHLPHQHEGAERVGQHIRQLGRQFHIKN